jgi:hypothetical protein
MATERFKPCRHLRRVGGPAGGVSMAAHPIALRPAAPAWAEDEYSSITPHFPEEIRIATSSSVCRNEVGHACSRRGATVKKHILSTTAAIVLASCAGIPGVIPPIGGNPPAGYHWTPPAAGVPADYIWQDGAWHAPTPSALTPRYDPPARPPTASLSLCLNATCDLSNLPASSPAPAPPADSWIADPYPAAGETTRAFGQKSLEPAGKWCRENAAFLPTTADLSRDDWVRICVQSHPAMILVEPSTTWCARIHDANPIPRPVSRDEFIANCIRGQPPMVPVN